MNEIGDVLSWKREQFEYTKCYCEENIWKLVEALKLGESRVLDQCWVVFISNDDRTIPLWKQKAGHQDSNHLVIWDYHVILVVRSEDNSSHEEYVVDFDTVLPFVFPLKDYYDLAIQDESQMIDSFKRKFRVIKATEYFEKFASDRSHMLRIDDSGVQVYASPPPSYPPIETKDSKNNIQDFISMNSSAGCGQVLNLVEFLRYFTMNK
uniref:Protein N-terminal glutamine amidohydrolase n=1 Tax=Lygus hesperus TaxID=30085 RepID=A0A0A9Z8C0_LYGHE